MAWCNTQDVSLHEVDLEAALKLLEERSRTDRWPGKAIGTPSSEVNDGEQYSMNLQVSAGLHVSGQNRPCESLRL